MHAFSHFDSYTAPLLNLMICAMNIVIPADDKLLVYLRLSMIILTSVMTDILKRSKSIHFLNVIVWLSDYYPKWLKIKWGFALSTILKV